MLDDLTIAFAMRCDERGLSVNEGIAAAEKLADELIVVAEDRSFAPKDDSPLPGGTP